MNRVEPGPQDCGRHSRAAAVAAILGPAGVLTAATRLRGHLRDLHLFQTSIELRPTLQRQQDHAAAHDQTRRADLFFTRLLDGLDRQAS